MVTLVVCICPTVSFMALVSLAEAPAGMSPLSAVVIIAILACVLPSWCLPGSWLSLQWAVPFGVTHSIIARVICTFLR